MIPKVNSCVAALAGGVRKAHIIDARIQHALLLEIFTDRGIGTQIVKNSISYFVARNKRRDTRYEIRTTI